MSVRSTFQRVFRERSGAGAFFLNIIVWGVGTGCFAAVLNNYLVDAYNLNAYERGWLEFFREMPGLLLVFVLALMHRYSDWKILRIASLISMLGVASLQFAVGKHMATFLIMIWSLGEHLAMPVRTSIAMLIAREGKQGQSLGFVSGALNAGTVAGSLIVALIFYLGLRVFEVSNKLRLYNMVWLVVLLLVFAGFLCTLRQNSKAGNFRRPRLYFNRKFNLYYGLELFYGARKQIFLTFAPFVLIKNYGLNTSQIALLFGFCAVVNIFGSPIIGRLTDRLGYRNTMIWDTVVLFFVCILYGYSHQWFEPRTALVVVCLNYLLDAILSTTSLASNLYVRDISSSTDETTSTISTGISINHLISIATAPLGGWVWMRYGVGMLFNFAALMALANSACAYMIKPQKTP